MPNRVIREGLLDSERYWACTIEARELYRHLQLLADDLGCVSLAPVFLRRRCFNSAPTNEHVDGLLEQLVAHDLVRMYEALGARYGFLPRFGQRLRRMKLKHPRPPQEMLRNDDDAIQKFSKIKGNILKLSDMEQSDDGQVTDTCRPEVEVEVNRSEKNRKEVEGTVGQSDSAPHAAGKVNVKGRLKNIPFEETSNGEGIERNRRIASAMASGNPELAKRIREGTA